MSKVYPGTMTQTAEIADRFKPHPFIKLRADHGDKIARWVLDHGQQFEIGPETYKGRRGRQGLCFMNATHLAWDNPELFYVEGYVCIHGISIEHAWVCDKDRNIFDPTLRVAPDKSKNLRNDPTRITDYFGVVFGHAYLRRATLANGYYGLFANASTRALVTGQVKDWQP